MVVVLFTTLPLMSMGYDYYTEGKVELKLPFLAKYFFDPLTKTMWPIMYVHQVWSSKFLASMSVYHPTYPKFNILNGFLLGFSVSLTASRGKSREKRDFRDCFKCKSPYL